ncbi:hypothetical protein RHGRI_036545 [Rhododendron griersonianum]|uniref:TF-B3 domain-containing protein n=1 Tax=Rhododendron griersonianum TaxID=479676 RepID=A0AAV6HNW2_9ERIC|nr:hypothetical protein RHGRI_036545 [Rhododendron griersonianum]
MSESRGLDSGPSDKEGEKGKDSTGEGKEKEGKSVENVSEEVSVADTEVAEKKNVRTSGEENVNSDSPSKKKLKQSNVPQEKSGVNCIRSHCLTTSFDDHYRDGSKRPYEDVQPYTDPNEPGSDSDSDSDTDSVEMDYCPDEVFLFEMEVPKTNRLVIPFELASTHFPPLNTRKPNEKQIETLEFTDSQNHEWYMPIQYYSDEHGFMILTGWQKFSTQYNLQPMDLIRILKPVPRLHTHHFLIEVEKKQGTVEIPEFIEENFLFQIEVDQSDIEFRRVFLARDDVRNFPGVEMQRNSREKKMMRFTDKKCKHWYMNIIRYSEKYMVIDGWDEFVKERGLEAGDLVVFFKHEHPCHSKHYLIGIVRKEGRLNPGQPSGGSGAGSSSGSRKGKEIAGGD